METFSALLALCAGNSPVTVNSPHKGQWRGALMFSLIYAWINHWVNNREAGDLRRHHGHCDVNVMNWSVLACRQLTETSVEPESNFNICDPGWCFEGSSRKVLTIQYGTICAGSIHWGRDKMDAISQTTFSRAFSWMEMFEFRIKFHWGLFLVVQLTIFQQWFR